MAATIKHIDPEISKKYGIVNYGQFGMQILHGGKSVIIFKDKSTQLENWLAAVAYAKEMYYTPQNIADIATGTGGFLKQAADDLSNPPYGFPT